MKLVKKLAHIYASTRITVNNVSYLDHLISEDDFEIRQRAIPAQLSSAMSSIASFTVFSDSTERKTSTCSGRMPGSETLKRQRRDMGKYFHGMDDRLFCRKYRMDKTSFYRLLYIIQVLSLALASRRSEKKDYSYVKRGRGGRGAGGLARSRKRSYVRYIGMYEATFVKGSSHQRLNGGRMAVRRQ